MNINISKLNNIYKLDRTYIRLSDEWKDKDINLFEFLTNYENNIVKPKNLILKPSVTLEYENGKFIASINLNRTDKNTRRMSVITLFHLSADSFYELMKELKCAELENNYCNINDLFLSQKDTYIIISKSADLKVALFSGKDTTIKKCEKASEESLYDIFAELDIEISNKLELV